MKSIRDISSTLRTTASAHGMRQADLKAAAGISQRTLTNVFSGTEDYKVSTLLALADRVGLELVLVPKPAAAVVEAGKTTAPRIKSRVAAALERVQSPPRPGNPPAGAGQVAGARATRRRRRVKPDER